MASAGYDPQVAPKVYEIIENINQVSQESELYHKHPSGRKRAKKLAGGEVMKKASSRYSKVMTTFLVRIWINCIYLSNARE